MLYLMLPRRYLNGHRLQLTRAGNNRTSCSLFFRTLASVANQDKRPTGGCRLGDILPAYTERQVRRPRWSRSACAPCVHCCKPLNPLQWCCIAFSPAWIFLYSIAYIAYWNLSIIMMLQVPPWYKAFILLFNNELNVGAHFAALCMLMQP